MMRLSGSTSVTRHLLGMLALICALYLVLAFIILRFSVYASFAGLEAEMVTEDAGRVRRILAGEMESLQGINQEWSAWDDTYEYLSGRNPEYAGDYLIDDTLVSSNVDVMALWRRDGTPIWASMVDPATEEPLDTAPLLAALDTTRPPFDSLAEGARPVSGVVSGPYGTVVIVAMPVLRTDASGPSIGVLAMGRRLSPAMETSLADRVGVPFRVYDSNSIPTALSGTWNALVSAGSGLETRVQGASVDSYQILSDLWGNPAVLLEATTPRRVTSIGRETMLAALAMLMVALLVFSLSLWWFLSRSVISPLRSLRNHVAALRTKGDLNRRIGWNRRDEIGALAQAFDALTGRLQESIDESERVRATAVSALRARSDFLARMSHEIRTPMNGVIGMTSIMLDSGTLDEEGRLALETIHDSGRSLLAIIDDILDLAKIEAGKQRLVNDTVDVRQTVNDSVALLQPMATQGNLELIVELDPALAPLYLVDAGRLRQVLTNLVGNAIKFTPSGRVVLSVSARNPGIHVAVTDTGIGIRPENLLSVFDSFSQEDSGRSRRFGGTGLGLTISKQLVEMMGGTLGVESTPGAGSTFWFELPLAAAAVQPLRSKSPRASAGVPSERPAGLRVLVVEDNRVNRLVAEQMLRKLSCKVTQATNGEEAMGAFREGMFDLVLMDCEMPVMDGYEATRRIRAREAAERSPPIPIVALTANVLQEDRQRCLDAGMNDVLTKPITLERLAECLSTYHGGGVPQRAAGSGAG